MNRYARMIRKGCFPSVKHSRAFLLPFDRGKVCPNGSRKETGRQDASPHSTESEGHGTEESSQVHGSHRSPAWTVEWRRGQKKGSEYNDETSTVEFLLRCIDRQYRIRYSVGIHRIKLLLLLYIPDPGTSIEPDRRDLRGIIKRGLSL